MSLLAPTPHRVAIQERVTVVGGVPVTASSTEVFYAQLSTSGPPPTGEFSPRIQNTVEMRYPADALLLPPPGAGSSLLIDTDTFVVVNTSTPLKSGLRQVAWAVPVCALADAFPLSGDLYDATDTLIGSMSFSLWNGADSDTSAGEYEDRDAEAPFSFYAVLKAFNVKVHFGADVWRVTSVTLDVEEGITKIKLRNTRGD